MKNLSIRKLTVAITDTNGVGHTRPGQRPGFNRCNFQMQAEERLPHVWAVLCAIVASLCLISTVHGQSTEISYTLDIHSGLNCIANQLDHGSNNLDEVLTALPAECILYKFNNASGTWTQASFDVGLGTWTPPGITLSPGEGAFLQSPVSFSFTINGRPHVPVLPISNFGGCYLLSRQTNDLGTFENILGFPPLPSGSFVFKWKGVSYEEYYTDDISGTGWFDPNIGDVPEPTAAVGEAMWFAPNGGATPPNLPDLADKAFQILSIASSAGVFQLGFESIPGRSYLIQARDNLGPASDWTTVDTITAGGGIANWADPSPPSTNRARFYRIAYSPPRITGIEPSTVSGSGGLVYFRGQGFQAGDQLYIGGILVNITFLSPSLISAILPGLPPGSYDVQLIRGNQVLMTWTLGLIVAAGVPLQLTEPPRPPAAKPVCIASMPSASAPFFDISEEKSTGEFRHEANDLHIPGRGMDFNWIRQYRSRIGPNTEQGNGWDYSYNIFIQMSGTNVLVADGSTRRDIFYQQPDGSYGADQFFCEGRFTNTVFNLTFGDSGRWEFLPLNATVAPGKISRIVDRNGNQINFSYDPLGRLTNINDTLNRDIAVAYNADGFIDSVTDFTGRQVHYLYYQNSDPDGSFGDLRAGITPAVTGTPNGNDFPGGKTNTYTYSKNLFPAELNHNLLTMTDPKGQTWLKNTYAPTTDPNDPLFDRLMFQTKGNLSDVLTYYYLQQTPGPANNYAVMRTIINDRVGNVKEYFYDSRNRLLLEREYTGRATVGVTTTDVENRPINKLRVTDPDLYDTHYEWNADSVVTRVINPNGNSTENVYQLDLDPSANRKFRQNKRITREIAGVLGGDQTMHVEQFEYAVNLGGCCGFNFVTKYTDARGNITLHSYDPNGNRTNTIQPIATITESWEYNPYGQPTSHTLPDNGTNHFQRNEMVYYTSGPQTGYLQKEIKDAPGFALTTIHEYDAVGNVIRNIDPRGHDTLYTVNALNQVVRETSREVTTGSGVRYDRLSTFDANNNVIQTDTANIDETGVVQIGHPYFTSTSQFEILNYPVKQIQEVSPTNTLSHEFVYDGNRNQINIRYGEAVAGRQTNNTLSRSFDERELLFKETDAAGHTAQSTTQHDYDGNGNLARASEGLEGTPHISTFTYDGFDREKILTDPRGNQMIMQYDANDNETLSQIMGESGNSAGTTNRQFKLSQEINQYDAMNRQSVESIRYFDINTGAPIGSGLAVVQNFYSGCGNIIRELDEKGNTNSIIYDTLNRKSAAIDAASNTVTYIYDANNNLIQTIEVERSDLGGTNQTFITQQAFDNLDRLISRTDNLGNVSRKFYDSHNRLMVETDSRTNTIRHAYDSLGRLLQTIRYLTDTGDGQGTVTGSIATAQTWDDSSRLLTQTDDNGNTTTYDYDPLNRRTVIYFADGTTNTTTYDVHGNHIQMSDANSNVVVNFFDENDRLASRSITPGPGIIGPTFEIYTYDGEGRMLTAADDDSYVSRTYDSLSHVNSETQEVLPSGPPRTVSTIHDEADNPLTTTYPGGRAVQRAYDRLHRLKTVAGGGAIATYNYSGPRRVQRRDNGNNTRLTVDYDGLRRITNHFHSKISNGSPIDRRQYSWDPANNKTEAVNLLSTPIEHRAFNNDSDNRLTRSQRLPVGTPIDYAFDGVGNRTAVSGGSDAGTYFMNAGTPEPSDRQRNNYTSTPFDTRDYDRNGNLIRAGIRHFMYNYRNQMAAFYDDGAGFTNYYKYDVYGRRIEKNIAGVITRHYYEGQAEIEEQNAADVTAATFVWGRTKDELIQVVRTNTYFCHEDDQGNLMALTDTAGNVVERYDYDDYGQPTVMSSNGLPISASAVGNPFLFSALRYDKETGLYYCKTRYFEPRTGRFTTPDTIGIWGDEENLGNGFTYVHNNPWSYVDPTGMSKKKREERKEKRAQAKAARKVIRDEKKAKRVEKRAERKEKRKERREIRKEYRHERKELRKEYRAEKKDARKTKRSCLAYTRANGLNTDQCREAKKERMKELRYEYRGWVPHGEQEEKTVHEKACAEDFTMYCDEDNDCLKTVVFNGSESHEPVGPCEEVEIPLSWESGHGQFSKLRKEKRDALHDLRWWH